MYNIKEKTANKHGQQESSLSDTQIWGIRKKKEQITLIKELHDAIPSLVSANGMLVLPAGVVLTI